MDHILKISIPAAPHKIYFAEPPLGFFVTKNVTIVLSEYGRDILVHELSTRERIILAIDTSNEEEAERLANIAHGAGALIIKLGLELSTATSWRHCSELAASQGLGWIADAKLDDIPNTVVGAIKNFKKLEHPPFGITLHTTTGVEAMRAAQKEAGDIKIFGVTVLSSTSNKECERIFGSPVRKKVVDLAEMASTAGLKGVVCSPEEVGIIKRNKTTHNLFTLIPGSRSAEVKTQDQTRVGTPAKAIKDGADLLVIGRQITQSDNPIQDYEDLVAEIETAAI